MWVWVWTTGHAQKIKQAAAAGAGLEKTSVAATVVAATVRRRWERLHEIMGLVLHGFAPRCPANFKSIRRSLLAGKVY
jgi:hypothetical protein